MHRQQVDQVSDQGGRIGARGGLFKEAFSHQPLRSGGRLKVERGHHGIDVSGDLGQQRHAAGGPQRDRGRTQGGDPGLRYGHLDRGVVTFADELEQAGG
jgi:hypothetical protein